MRHSRSTKADLLTKEMAFKTHYWVILKAVPEPHGDAALTHQASFCNFSALKFTITKVRSLRSNKADLLTKEMAFKTQYWVILKAVPEPPGDAALTYQASFCSFSS